MAQQTINVGTAPNDGTGTPLRTAFQYTNSNFSELYTAVGPSGNNIVCPGTLTVAAGTLALPSLTTAGDTNTGIYFPAADTIGFVEGGVEAMRINSAGNLVVNNAATITGDLTVRTNRLATTTTGVGIGTASPNSALEVAGSIRTTNAGGSASASTGVFDYVAGTTTRFVSYGANTTTAGAFQFTGLSSNASVGDVRYGIDATGIHTWQNVGGVAGTAMTLNSTGLLVGTANNFASSRLCVQGTAGTSTPDVTIGIPVNSSGNTNLAIGRSASTNGYIFLDAYKAGVGGTELVLNSVNGGSVLVGLSTVVAAGGCLQLKSGITFPATQVASSDANTLDDYEEGTWTPTVAAASGTPVSTTVNSAVYTKIGRLVVVQIDITIVDKGTASSSLIFSLPFNQTTAINTGAFRESSVTGNMGVLGRNGPTDAFAAFYNNGTPWVNGYRIAGTYTYHV